jgi:hypothetical protein
MNRLLTSAILAAVATNSPVWAQSPSTYSSGALSPSYARPAAPEAQTPVAQAATMAQQAPEPQAGAGADQAMKRGTQRRRAMRGRHTRHHGARSASVSRRSSAPNDNVADQLNREEMNRVVSGSGMQPTGGAEMSPAGMPTEGAAPQMAPAPRAVTPGPRPSGR